MCDKKGSEGGGEGWWSEVRTRRGCRRDGASDVGATEGGLQVRGRPRKWLPCCPTSCPLIATEGKDKEYRPSHSGTRAFIQCIALGTGDKDPPACIQIRCPQTNWVSLLQKTQAGSPGPILTVEPAQSDMARNDRGSSTAGAAMLCLWTGISLQCSQRQAHQRSCASTCTRELLRTKISALPHLTQSAWRFASHA